MSPDFQSLMRDATQFTRSGKLAEAQAAIRAALGAAAPGPGASPVSPPTVIDVAALVRDLPSIPMPNLRAPMRMPGRTPRPSGMTSGRHAAAGLQCDYELFVPRDAGDRRLPLVLMLHGCTQDPADFAAGTRMNDLAQEHGFIVLYPAQSLQMNPQGCWNWFKHSHQRRGRGEPELLASLTRDVMRLHNVDPERVYVAGLSAGGAMAAVLGRCYPDLYAAVGVHSGLAAGVAHDLPSALAAMSGTAPAAPMAADGKPVIVFHGDADTTVRPQNAAAVVAGSTAAPGTAEPVRPEGAAQRRATRHVHRAADGRVIAEHWTVHGAAHAWSGGSAEGSYTDPAGPDASAAMWRFFQDHPLSMSRDGARSATSTAA